MQKDGEIKGIISQINSAKHLKLKDLKTSKLIDIELAYIDIPSEDEPWGFEAKEYVRGNFIGNEALFSKDNSSSLKNKV